ncbi:MAG: class I SAM-dependent methyltransferase [Dehalococcoidia bacterium]|nr:class I SAM-dependent methyltransferase [Dehalococcoidia bacterium]
MSKIFNEREDMRLGKFEYHAMNNPLRRWVQKHIEFKIFKDQLTKARIELNSKAIMDGGCGSGYGTELILSEFHPSRIVAFDFMPEQISLAKKRGLKVDFTVGDLTIIDANDETFDAVFIFGVLHHIPQWIEALMQISRVLKPGGILMIEEPRYRFDWSDFESGIEQANLEIVDLKTSLAGYFHFYLCRKPD